MLRPGNARARLSMLLAAGLLAACDRTPTAPPTVLTTTRPSYAISDAAHGGAPGFYFLAPLVPAPAYRGTFDATQQPVVRVCELAGTACGAAIASFTGAQVKVDLAAQAYTVGWKLKDSGLDASKIYRIEVRANGRSLGYADVVVLANGSQIKLVDRTEFGVSVGGTLSIRFRIETGAASPAGPWRNGDVITFAQEHWGTPTDASASILGSNFTSLFAASFGLFEVGAPGASGFSILFSGAAQTAAYLPATGAAAPLDVDYADPTSTSSGTFGGEVTALALNVAFADGGAGGAMLTPDGNNVRYASFGRSVAGFADLTLCNYTAPSGLNGLSVRQFLGLVNTLLGGGSTPYTIADLSQIAAELNAAFANGVATPYALQHLAYAGCKPVGWRNGDMLSLTPTQWGTPVPGKLLERRYGGVYESSYGLMELGVVALGAYALVFSSASNVEFFLPAFGLPKALGASQVDPSPPGAGGVFGGEVTALKLNLDFSDAGIVLGTTALRFGDLRLCGLSGAAAVLNGTRVRDAFAIANTALAGLAAPLSIPDLYFVTTEINRAFAGGVVSQWAQQHIAKSACS
ncbi:MAG TPA: hypothetical protein VM076_07445 [Gemmatimonadaceae bacterium]|nr:hypothetical protein [Gemmatimonadaceae bacterium]